MQRGSWRLERGGLCQRRRGPQPNWCGGGKSACSRSRRPARGALWAPGAQGPVWLPTPSSPRITPSRRKHDRGQPCSGLCSRGWEACSRGLVSHWDPGLPFAGSWTGALSTAVLSLSTSESGISESPASSTTSSHTHACARVVGGEFEGNNLTGQRVHPRDWRKRLCPVASGPVREHQKHPPKQPPTHSSMLV